MPDTFAVLVNIPYPVEGHVMVDTITINKLKEEVIVRIKINALKGQAHNTLLQTIKVADFKHTPGKV